MQLDVVDMNQKLSHLVILEEKESLQRQSHAKRTHIQNKGDTSEGVAGKFLQNLTSKVD